MSDPHTTEGKRLLVRFADLATTDRHDRTVENIELLARYPTLGFYFARARLELVAGARDSGRSWGDIGRALDEPWQTVRRNYSALVDTRYRGRLPAKPGPDPWHSSWPYASTNGTPPRLH